MGLGLRILHMLLNRPRAFTWYFSQNFHVRNYEVFFLCSPLNNSCRIFTPMALSRRVEHSGGLRLSLSGTVRSWSSFYDLSGARSYLPPFLSIFCIVSRLSEQRLGNHSEKVFFDMHSGRLSICTISTDYSYLIFGLYFTFVTDFTVNRPVWPSNTWTLLEREKADYLWIWSSLLALKLG